MIHLQQLFLWNPATREYKLLPHLDSLPFKYEYTLFGFQSDCLFGFGFDESHDDYKLVVLIRKRIGPGYYSTVYYSVHSYSLRTDSWTQIEDIYGFGDNDIPLYGKFVNGRLHWAGTFGEERRILSFDLGTEEFGFVEQPTQKTCRAEVVDECLSLLCMPVSCEIDIWVMKEYGLTDSWCLVARVSLLDAMFSLLLPLHLLPNGDIVYHHNYSELVVYSTKYNAYRKLPIKCQGLCLQDDVGATIQSLVSPN